MRLLVLILVIVGGLWFIASVGSARADTDRAALEMGRPLPEVRRVFDVRMQPQDDVALVPVWAPAAAAATASVVPENIDPTVQ